jgi:hypothetical protein
LSPTQVSAEERDTRGVEDPEQSGADRDHLLFVPASQGYLLVEQSGTVPRLGEVVELPETPGARLIAAKLGSSPLPHDGRICVYLTNL